jgi:uncharacterized protein (DUF427 family)
MALTIGNSLLARSPGGKFNFEIERLPRHLLYLEDFQKRIRGQLAGKTIVDSRRGKLLHETGKLAQWYVPREDVEARALEPSGRRQEHPFRGVATYYNVRAGDRSALDAAWSYEQPEGLLLAGLVAFEFDKLDGWLEEDDPVRGHPRDPYHRFDCNHTSELVVVHVGGQVVAETRRAIKLFRNQHSAQVLHPDRRRDARLSRAVDVTTYLLPIQRRGCVFQRPRGADDRAGSSLDPSRPDR